MKTWFISLASHFTVVFLATLIREMYMYMDCHAMKKISVCGYYCSSVHYMASALLSGEVRRGRSEALCTTGCSSAQDRHIQCTRYQWS